MEFLYIAIIVLVVLLIRSNDERNYLDEKNKKYEYKSYYESFSTNELYDELTRIKPEFESMVARAKKNYIHTGGDLWEESPEHYVFDFYYSHLPTTLQTSREKDLYQRFIIIKEILANRD